MQAFLQHVWSDSNDYWTCYGIVLRLCLIRKIIKKTPRESPAWRIKLMNKRDKKNAGSCNNWKIQPSKIWRGERDRSSYCSCKIFWVLNMHCWIKESPKILPRNTTISILITCTIILTRLYSFVIILIWLRLHIMRNILCMFYQLKYLVITNISFAHNIL